MKKGFGKLLAIVVLCLCAFLPIFVSCEGNKDTIRITLVYDSQLTTSANDVEYVDKDILGSELTGRINPHAIEGYNFLGWSLTKGGELISGSTKLTNDTILYAVYQRKSFTITYDLNGYVGESTLEAKLVNYNQDATLATADDVATAGISRPNYTFGGWYANANCTGSAITAFTSVEANKTVYAKWVGDTRSITCYTYNGTVYTKTVGYIQSEYGQTVLVPTKTLRYHKFLGLSRENPADISTIVETEVVDFPVNTDIVVDWTDETMELYEVWCYDTFSMKALKADGSYETVSERYKSMDGEEEKKFVVPEVYAIYGYNFTQWRDVVTGSTYNPGQELSITRNYTLTPDKTAKNVTVTIKYHQDGDSFDSVGTGEEVKTFKFGETVTLANYASLIDNGFVLEGWSLNEDFSDSVETIELTSSSTVPNTFAITIYSKVSQATNDVSFCTKIGDTENLEQYVKVSVIYDRDLDLTTLSAEQKTAILDASKTNKTGHTFVGFKIVGGDNTIYTLDGANETATVINNVTGAVNLIPAYTVNNYKVIYYISTNQTLEELESDRFDYNTAITFRKTAGTNIAGKKFAGWSTIDFLPVRDGQLMPAGNLTVYAEWTTFDFEVKGETEATKYVSITGFVNGATGDKEISNGKLVIPAFINGYPVKEIANNAFEGKTNFTELLIEYDDEDAIVLTKIGNRAFADTKINTLDLFELTNVTFGSEAFANTEIVSLNIPNEWKTKIEELYTYKTNTGVYEVKNDGSIGAGLFKGNLKLTSVIIGNQITALAPNMFENCAELQVVEINQNSKFEHFAPYAFAGTKLAFTNGRIWLPKTLKYVDEGCFKNVTTIARIDCEINLVTIGASAFEGCTALEEINFFDWTMTGMASYQPAIRTIKANAFKGTAIIVLDFKYITTIEAGAFEGCTGLASEDGYIEFYDNSITIQPEAFKNCGEIDVYGEIPASFTSETQTGTTIVDCNK